MGENEDVGLKTSQTAKIIQETENKVKSARVELDFYSTEFPYTSVEGKSANHLFGNGKWKKACIDAFGREIFDKYAERHTEGKSSRTIDFKLVAFNTAQASYFVPNEKINVTDAKGVYTTQAKVLAVEDKKQVIIMMPFTGNSTGKILNITRRDGAKKAFDRFSQMLTDMKPTNNKESESKESGISNKKSEIKESVIRNQESEVKESVIRNQKSNKNNTKKILITILILVVGAIAISQLIKTKKTT